MKHLIFWKGLEDVSFKQTDEGEVYYPYGPLMAGYVVDEPRKTAIRSEVRHLYGSATILVVLGAFAGSFGGWRGLLLLPGVLIWAVYHDLRLRSILRGAPRSRHRLSFTENQHAMARRMSNARLVTALAINVAMIALFFFLTLLVLTKYDHTMFAIALGGFLFFCFSLAMTGRIAWLKWGEAKPS
jgi:hypothetical protein